MFSHLLAGKTAFVTGGSRGLGRALCLRLAAHGANVAFNFASDRGGADETLAGIRDLGVSGEALQVSVTDAAALSGAVREIESKIAPLDILVNNAGVSQPLPVALLEERDWDHVLQINLKGYYLAARAVLPGFIRRKCGVILNIGSLAGLRLIEAPVHYSASKAGAKGLTEALCKEVARYGIRVNCLAPGLLEDGVGNALPQHRLKDYVEHVAMRRVGRLDEVAEFAAFLVSERNTYMTGATIVMDGGL